MSTYADADGYGWRFARLMRRLPIRWRILTIAAVTTVLVLILAAVIWDSARSLNMAWRELTQVREAERALVTLEGEAGYLQNLIHRYFNQPNEPMLEEIVQLRQSLLTMLRGPLATDSLLAGSAETLVDATERLVSGFDDLRIVQSSINHTYELEVLKNAREMSGLYAIIEGATDNRNSLIWPALNKSRDAFSTALVAINAFYFSQAPEAATEARKSIDTIERTIPVMIDLADNDLQRNALGALGSRAYSLRLGLGHLAGNIEARTRLLRDEIDGNQAAMVETIATMALQMRGREFNARQSFEQALYDVFLMVALVGILFLAIVVAIGLAVSASISGPLRGLMASMHGIVGGDYGRGVPGLKERDEIGEMARAVEVFRHNAIAKRQAEDELRASKERAENALSELRDAQHSLIEAEKLAALGGLVAGVAHEVNNPIGISLTVASSFAHRSEVFARELREGPLRRSRLDEFIEGSRNAATQLVANLQRAGELIRSFKQVAVDRSHADRRAFDLREATEQIVASLRPGLRKSQVDLVVEIPDAIRMDSYPGPYGQVLTNLFLNAVAHGFADGKPGTIRVRARPLPGQQVEITFADDGAGMNEEVQRRAFDPFFTTRRGDGGTGLGLHIVYNLVTYRLGGRMTLESNLGRGTTFRIVAPLSAPRDEFQPLTKSA